MNRIETKVLDKVNILMVDDQPGKLLSYEAVLAELGAVRRLILRAPSLAKDEPMPSMNQAQSFRGDVQHEFDSIKILRRYSGDVLIIESEKDEVIPRSHISEYLRACSGAQHKVIGGATHALTNPAWDDVFVAAIIDWFKGL